MLLNVVPVIAETENSIEVSDLPSSFSWCNINGIDYTAPVKNQTPAPTCEAYALCTCLEILM